jgi:flagellin
MSNLVIATNVSGINSHRSLKLIAERSAKASEKLSSGFRINRAADDAAGLAISEKMRNQIKGLNMASKNAADGIALIQTAEGALQEVHEMLKRMRELVIQGANDTNVTGDRMKIAQELMQLVCEIDETAMRTEYNTKKLINGDVAGDTAIFLQVGANADQNLQFGIVAMSFNALVSSSLGMIPSAAGWTTLSITKSHFTPDALAGNATMPFHTGRAWSSLRVAVDHAISNVSTQRSHLGSLQNRLEHTIRNLDVASENLSAAESRIRDTDMAKEMMEFTKTNILSQAGMSMLSQANQNPNNVLQLLR